MDAHINNIATVVGLIIKGIIGSSKKDKSIFEKILKSGEKPNFGNFRNFVFALVIISENCPAHQPFQLCWFLHCNWTTVIYSQLSKQRQQYYISENLCQNGKFMSSGKKILFFNCSEI